MVLHAQVCGRVGRRRELILDGPPSGGPWFLPPGGQDVPGPASGA